MKNTVKKSLFFWSGLICLGTAHAQSSVTVYGKIDAGVSVISNDGGARNYKFEDGVLYGNRIGFKGTEDLGNGMSAIFVLENGFGLGTGRLAQGGALFGRQAYVGVKNAWGSFTMGNQTDFVWDYMVLRGYDISAAATGYAVHQGDLDGFGGRRLKNSVKYSSASFNGFSLGSMYSFGETAGNFHQGSSSSTGLSYAKDNFSSALVYTRLNNPSGLNAQDPYAQFGVKTLLGQTVATVDPATGQVNDLFGSSPFKVDSLGALVLGASYVVGKATIAGTISNTALKGFGQSATMRVYELGLQYQFTPVFYGTIAGQHTTLEDSRWNQGSVGLGYNLSKRTLLYGGVDFVRASTGVNANIGYSFNPSSTNQQVVARFGMVHSF